MKMDSISRRRLFVFVILILNFFLFFYRPPQNSQPVPVSPPDTPIDLFSGFEGYEECRVTVPQLYNYENFPVENGGNGPYCPIRETLLKAMTEGGRHGFDAPYAGKGT